MSSFGYIQKQENKSFQNVTHISLCNTMDLIAVLTDTTLSIYRTLTWKRILLKNESELIESLGNNLHIMNIPLVKSSNSNNNGDSDSMKPHYIQFAPSGKLIAIGCNHSILITMDVESGNCYHCVDFDIYNIYNIYNIDSNININAYQYNSITWCPIDKNNYNNYNQYNSVSGNGVDLVHSYGMSPMDMENKSTTHGVIELLLQESCLICSIVNSVLIGYIYGIYPLFHIDMAYVAHMGLSGLAGMSGNTPNINTNICVIPGGLLCQDYDYNKVYVAYNGVDSTSSNTNTNNTNGNGNGNGGLQVCSIEELLKHTPNSSDNSSDNCNVTSSGALIEANTAQSLVEMHMQLHTILELIQTSGRKWKDAVKVILPKLNLLCSVLKGYDMQMGPIKFYYSVVMCGHWHPAVTTVFSSHWNNAGIARLLTGIDVSSKTIIKEISFRIYPLLVNMILRLKHMRSEYSTRRSVTSKNSSNSSSGANGGTNSPQSTQSAQSQSVDVDVEVCKVDMLLSQVEGLIFKVDEALLEVNRARDGFFLFIQVCTGVFWCVVVCDGVC